MFRQVWRAAVIMSMASLIACATAQSRYVPKDEATANSAGVTYFLPVRMVKVTATRTPLKIEDLKKAKAATAEAAEKAKKAKEEADSALRLAEDRLKRAPTNAGLLQARDVAKADAEVKADLSTEANAAAERAAGLLLAAETSGVVCAYSAKLELLPAQADPKQRFVARLHHNWFRDDSLTLKVAPSGLLTSTNAVAADRTGDIIVELAGAIAGLQTPGKGFHTEAVGETPEPAADCASRPRQFMGIFDPVAGATKINADLARAGFPIRVEVGEINQGLASTGVDWSDFSDEMVSTNLPSRRAGAIFYRSAVPVMMTLQQAGTPDCSKDERTLRLAMAEFQLNPSEAAKAEVKKAADIFKDCSSRAWQDIDAAIVMLPQAGPISYIPMNSRAFVKTVDDVQFADGTIASWSTERPSEVLEVVRLPVKVLKAVVSVPAELISLRVNFNSAERSLAESQRLEMEMENKLRVLKDCIAKAERESQPASSCFPS